MVSADTQPPISVPAASGVPIEQAPAVVSRAQSARSRLLTALIVLGGVTVLVVGVAVGLGYLHVQTVISNSMQPTFSAGDLVVTQPVSISAIHAGDVIAFLPTASSQRPVIHRVVAFDDGVMTTKGDGNSREDPWRLSPDASATAYRLVLVVPYAGWLSQFQMPLLLLALLFAALAVVQIAWKEVATRLVSKPKSAS